MKRKIILTVFLMLNLGFAVAQAKNSRKKYTAVDNHTYKKGETLAFGVPARGTQYENIFINDIITTGDYISMFTGGSVEKKSSDNATKEQLSALGNKATIKYFANGIENNKLVVLKLDNKKEIRAFFDKALQNGEIKSQAQDFQTTADKIFANATRGKGDGNGTVKSFSPKFDVKILSVVGDKKAQTVTVNLLISHKLVHQEVCINRRCSTFEAKSKCFDYEGNEYPYKEFGLGNKKSTYQAYNIIPTQVPLKAFVTFRQILPSVQGMSFISIPVTYRAEDGGDCTSGDLELSDLVIDWK
ncbi:hypothetical protein HMPREF1321_1239 [Capnocytophaga sp. oral taxon 412 str. F0487]|uniref:hypothetical protein n=1 Tax=Capnocytophaga sp. oral taxon 412 TaxID=712218 RepID=UPI00026975D9|nr:hypothetical protein [Capnocytophaga sp. oral taxon 412]EIW91257.1 hypothetical protein HMPREF1321_1239 [Capnocytophaga sp. oral taxon 412 str. F0487]